ncbi:hypothetical protein [Bradyrhizobium ottawaense]|uniref:hypothetical protein n=1 Tax=Bradyrhizobium ottawaense TaxID=931866 RepID=UPI003511A42F
MATDEVAGLSCTCTIAGMERAGEIEFIPAPHQVKHYRREIVLALVSYEDK